MDVPINPTRPDYTQWCVVKHQDQLLVSALTASDYVTPADLGCFSADIELKAALDRIDGLKAALDLVRSIEDEFRDEQDFSMYHFRRWFIQAALGLDCTEAAQEAMTGFKIPVGQDTIPAFQKRELELVPDEILLSLRESMVDYLTFPGLSRYMLANIARAQLGLRTINGSIPMGWHGLSFRDMVRAHLELITVPVVQPAGAIVLSGPARHTAQASLATARPN